MEDKSEDLRDDPNRRRGERPLEEKDEGTEGAEGREFFFLNLGRALEREQSRLRPGQSSSEEEASRDSFVESEGYRLSTFLESPVQDRALSNKEAESDLPGRSQPAVPSPWDSPHEKEFPSPGLRASYLYEHARQALGAAFSSLKSNRPLEFGSLEGLAKQMVANVVAFSPVHQYDVRSSLFAESLYGSLFESFGSPYDLVEHSINVATLSVTLAKERSVAQVELERLCLAALLHDVGMLLLPDEAWDHPRQLSEEEWSLVKSHAELGRERLTQLGGPFSDVAPIVGQEHERADGSGYPRGLSNKEIDELAKIIGVVDVFEALSHSRPHRPANSPHESVRAILQPPIRNSFDRGLVKGLLSLVTVFPLGSCVELSSGEVGRVVKVSGEWPLRPVVEVFLDAEGLPVKPPVVVELRSNLRVSVVRCLDEVPAPSGERLAQGPP